MRVRLTPIHLLWIGPILAALVFTGREVFLHQVLGYPESVSGEIMDIVFGTFGALVIAIVLVWLATRESSAYAKELKTARDKYLKVFENAPVAIATIDRKGFIVSANKTHLKLFGVQNPEDYIGKVNLLESPNVAAAGVLGSIKEVLEGSVVDISRLHYFPIMDNKELFISFKGVPLYDGSGKLEGGLFLIQDVTEEERGLQALEESEERFRTVFNGVNDVIFVHEPTPEGKPGLFLEVNQVACSRLGYSREEFSNLTIVDVTSPEGVQRIAEIFGALVDRGVAIFEVEHVTKDGRKIPVEVSARVSSLLGRRVILSIVRDITERKQAEEQLRASSAQLEMANKELHSLNEMIQSRLDKIYGDLRVVLQDRKAELVQRPGGELPGLGCYEFIESIEEVLNRD